MSTNDLNDIDAKLSKLQDAADRNSEALDALESDVTALGKIADAFGQLKATLARKGYDDAEDVREAGERLAAMQDRLERLENEPKPPQSLASFGSDDADRWTLPTGGGETHYLGEHNVRVADPDPLDDETDEESESIRVDEHLRNGGDHD